MGLNERRIAERIKTEQVPAFQQELEKITQTPIELIIDWDSFMLYNEYPLNRMEDNYFKPLISTFESICRDQMGRDAVKDGLSTIHMVHTPNQDNVGATFEKKVLTLMAKLDSDVYFSANASDIIKILEAKL